MKWIGQSIVDFIARFRSDVYLDSPTAGGSDPDKFLGIDSNNKIIYRTGAEVFSDIGAAAGDITGVTLTTDDEETISDTAGSADFTVAGGEGIDTTSAGSTVTIACEEASTSNKGVASFSSTNFAVSSGAVSLVANRNRTFTKTGNTDGTYDGDVVYFGGTTSMTVGTIYHYKSDGTWEVTNANAVATCDGLLGVALGAASDTNGMLLRGMVTLDHDPGAVGDVLFLSAASNGDATATAPSGSSDIVRVIGYCLDASNGQVWFDPDKTYVEVA